VKTSLLVCALVLSAWSDEQQPTPARLALAAELQKEVAVLLPRTLAVNDQLKRLQQELSAAGVVTKPAPNTRYEGSVPSREQMQTIDAHVAALTSEATSTVAACTAYDAKFVQLWDRASGEKGCKQHNDSMHENLDCTLWRKLDGAKWPAGEIRVGNASPCQNTAADALSWVNQEYYFWHRSWQHMASEEDALVAQDAVHLAPISGSPQQRVMPVPRSFQKLVGNNVVVDARGLFAAAHPSRFVFLRTDEKGGKRVLKKGEAVLVVKTLGRSEVRVIAVDGVERALPAEQLSVVPLAGLRPFVLTADDLDVTTDDGEVIAGPRWLAPDATGFFLDSTNAWLDLLDPPEPRTQRFFEAKKKAVDCYERQMKQLDPEGRLRRNYDLVTYGKNGVEKMESAETALDRRACSACGCKAFNDMKHKLIKAAIAPQQRAAFGAYADVAKRLMTTDFAAASKGAPKGKAPDRDDM
jgi:hypothetical protein